MGQDGETDRLGDACSCGPVMAIQVRRGEVPVREMNNAGGEVRW